jgi:hypothetical protein
MATDIQETIGYKFVKIELLHLALKSAHKSEEDGTADDGNRGLAELGLRTVDMVEIHHAIVAENGTKGKLC